MFEDKNLLILLGILIFMWYKNPKDKPRGGFKPANGNGKGTRYYQEVKFMGRGSYAKTAPRDSKGRIMKRGSTKKGQQRKGARRAYETPSGKSLVKQT